MRKIATTLTMSALCYFMLTGEVIINLGCPHCPGRGPSASAFQTPGPSLALFNNPYYQCNTNFYVATTGSDSNNGTSAGTPWATLQHADTIMATSPPSGSGSWCVNVSPGTYGAGSHLDIALAGGNAASATGYVVYRCTTPSFVSGSGCILTDSDYGIRLMLNNGGLNTKTEGPNYIIIDGFIMNAGGVPVTFGQGIETANFAANGPLCCHHIWLLNNIISNYGQSGFQGGETDFMYVIHNTFFGNSTKPSASIGSGISMAYPTKLAGYTYTADDKSNSVTGNLLALAAGLGTDYYRQVYSWNVLYNNSTDPGCASGACTDGNGIILDTFCGCAGNGPGPYAAQTLVSFNVMYNNGGFGFRMLAENNGVSHTAGAGVTIANNSSFNNNLWQSGTERGEIDEADGETDLVVNNLVFAERAVTGLLANNNTYIGGTNSITGTASSWQHNIGYCTNFDNTACYGMNGGATWVNGNDPAIAGASGSPTSFWTNVGNTTIGTVLAPPNGVNFVPSAGSPEIGYLVSETFIPAVTRDAGACDHSLTVCPCPAGC